MKKYVEIRSLWQALISKLKYFGSRSTIYNIRELIFK